MADSVFEKRQGSAFDGTYPYYDDGYGPADSWWWSTTGMAVRYAIVSLLFLIIIGYFLGGYLHARSRLSKGLQPLAYHRWMVRRRMYYATAHPYARQWPQYSGPPSQHYDSHGHAMPQHTYPPPAYNADQPPPPVYPDGSQGSKVAADQNFGGVTHREGHGSEGHGSEGASGSAPLPPLPPLPTAGSGRRDV